MRVKRLLKEYISMVGMALQSLLIGRDCSTDGETTLSGHYEWCLI